MEFDRIINQMAMLFFIIIIGFISAKLKILDDIACKKFSKFVIHLSAPALIISSVTGSYVVGNIKDMLTILLVAFGFFIITPVISIPSVKLLKVPKEDENLYRFMLVFYNIVFMGFPVVGSLYGEGAIFYASIFNFPNTLFLYSLGVYLVKSKKTTASIFEVKKLMNPGLFSIILAMVIFMFGIKLPVFLDGTLKMVGSVTTPLSLLVIGASLAAIPVKEVFTEKKLYPITFLTLIVIPLTVFFLLRLFIFNKTILGVTVVLTGMPVASIAVMFCDKYEGNSHLAAKAIFFTTIFSIISIPFLVLLLQIF
ncbi:MAG: AEC family transporter [Desulfitobacteriaceae bacterium]|nr:AEC family transporter [Desulfitobacteriaceae bacterium]MDD4346275.1 AEC family transporter [Desulfitobacteriaceae bacterium]MDD4400602.1 AEC family transporter [Desulfitobacteriaceae bacterium]